MDVFDGAIRSKGDLTGVFEYDETGGAQSATAYFYLSKVEGRAAGPIIGIIHVRSGAWPITEADVIV